MTLAMGMVGGGPGAFIGPVHRMAAERDGLIRLAAGVFSRDPERARQAGLSYGVAADRVYGDVASMIAGERARPDGIGFVTIATPNASHLPVACAALQAGLAVLSDKPATATLAEAQTLRQAVAASGALYALTHTYTGYALVREARALLAGGALGAVRKVLVDYQQGWLAAPVEADGNRQAAWRTDPAQSGTGGAVADIGVHAFNLAEYVTGCRTHFVLAELASIVPGRRLDDDGAVMLRLAGGARGLLTFSQVATGARNGLVLRVQATEGSLEWRHEDSQRLRVLRPGRPEEVRHAGEPYLSAESRAATRLPAGHPEGFVSALATIYGDFAQALTHRVPVESTPLCGIEEGVRGMAFVDASVRSSRDGGVWHDVAA